MAIFDLYGLLVEQIFGGLFLAIIGVAIFMVLIGLFSRMNTLTIMVLVGAFLTICFIYYSGITHFLMLIFILFYFVSSIIRLFSGGQG